MPGECTLAQPGSPTMRVVPHSLALSNPRTPAWSPTQRSETLVPHQLCQRLLLFWWLPRHHAGQGPAAQFGPRVPCCAQEASPQGWLPVWCVMALAYTKPRWVCPPPPPQTTPPLWGRGQALGTASGQQCHQAHDWHQMGRHLSGSGSTRPVEGAPDGCHTAKCNPDGNLRD